MCALLDRGSALAGTRALFVTHRDAMRYNRANAGWVTEASHPWPTPDAVVHAHPWCHQTGRTPGMKPPAMSL